MQASTEVAKNKPPLFRRDGLARVQWRWLIKLEEAIVELRAPLFSLRSWAVVECLW